jgi:integrase
MNDIMPIAVQPSKPHQLGGWQKVARRRYQKGCLRKRGRRDPVWELLYWEDIIKPDGTIGRRQTSQIVGLVRDMNFRQARKAADELLRPLNQGKVLPQASLSFLEFVEEYFVPNVFPTLKISTQKRYRRTLNTHLLPAFGKARLSEITNLEIQRFVLQKMHGGLGWECGNHFRNLMSKIFTTAKKWKFYPSDNPAQGVELPEKKAVREKYILDPAIIPRLLDSLAEPTRTMVQLGLLTGMRVGEILGLRWKDLDFSTGLIRIGQANYRGILGTPKTQSSRRTLPFPKILVEPLTMLQRSVKLQEPDALVFQTNRGTPFSDTNLLKKHLKPAGRKLGIPWLNWHSLRRTHATLFQVVGGSLRDAQAQLGHAKASTTSDIYTLPILHNQRDTVEKLGQLLTNVGELAPRRPEPRPLTQSIQ